MIYIYSKVTYMRVQASSRPPLKRGLRILKHLWAWVPIASNLRSEPGGQVVDLIVPIDIGTLDDASTNQLRIPQNFRPQPDLQSLALRCMPPRPLHPGVSQWLDIYWATYIIYIKMKSII